MLLRPPSPVSPFHPTFHPTRTKVPTPISQTTTHRGSWQSWPTRPELPSHPLPHPVPMVIRQIYSLARATATPPNTPFTTPSGTGNRIRRSVTRLLKDKAASNAIYQCRRRHRRATRDPKATPASLDFFFFSFLFFFFFLTE